MSFKTTYILFGLLIGVLAILGYALYVGPSGTGDTDYAIPSLHDPRNRINASDIETITIQRTQPKEETIQFVRDAESKNWKMTQPHPLRVDKFLVDRLVSQAMDARKSSNADLSGNLKDWGLDVPSAVVVLKKGDREWKLNLGKERPGQTTAVVYATSSDRPDEPIAVARSELDNVFKTANQFRSKDLLAESALNIVAVDLKEPKKDEVRLAKTSDDHWRFEKPAYGEAAEQGDGAPPEGDALKKITGVRDLLKAIEDIRVPSDTDFVAEGVTDMAQYGLDKNPTTLRIETKTRAGSMLGGDKDKEPVEEALLIGKKVDDKGDMLYARLESEDAVVKVAAKGIEPITRFLADPAALRNRDLVQIDQARADAIDIQNAGGLIKLRKPKATWRLFDKGKGQAADDLAITGLLSDLAKRRQIQFFPDAAKEKDMGLDKPAAVVTVWVSGIQPEDKKEEKADADKKDDKADADKDKKDGAKDKKEKDHKDADAEPKLKDAKPAVKLTFGKKDRDLVYVRRETAAGDTSVVEVPEALLGVVTQGPLAYRDRILPSFSESADVTEVVLARDGKTFDVKKDKDAWKLEQAKEPARAADAKRMDQIIADLRGLKAEKLVAEKPSAAELEKFGLKTPRYRATVKVQKKDEKKPEEWTYSFGNETEDKKVYATLDKQDLVFLVQPAVVQALQGDLRDKTVLSFDPNKVKSIKLSGWKKAVGSTYTLDLQRKAAKDWTAKTPADFEQLDSAQVETFVAGLADLKAEKFNAAPIEAKDKVLQIEITLDGEKMPRTLTIGGLDAKEKAYAAQSSQASGESFLVAQARFDKLLDGPKFFKKPDVAK
jgi:hypothetical protein